MLQRPWLRLVLVSLGLLGFTARAATWEPDGAFKPVLESATPNSGVVIPTALADGSVLVQSSYNYADGKVLGPIARFSSGGAIDLSYNAAVARGSYVLAVYGDGRALVATPSPGYPEPARIYRLSANGALDPSFQTVSVLSSSSVGARLLGNGQILVFGSFPSVNGVAGAKVARLAEDGALDATFASPFAENDGASVRDACAQADGKVVLTGTFPANGGTVGIVRLLSGGALDPQFNAPWFTVDGSAVAVLADGRILATMTNRTVVRLAADGTKDLTYAPVFSGSVVSIDRPLDNGRVYYVESTVGNSGSLQTLHRLNADGAVDPVFQFTTPYSASYAVGLPATYDESVFYFGSALTAERNALRQELSKLDASAAVVAGFAPRLSRNATLRVLGRASDGSYLISGSFDYVSGTALTSGGTYKYIRLKADGSLDGGFPPMSAADIDVVATASDGHFLAVTDRATAPHYARFAANGTLEVTYGIPSGYHLFALDEANLLYESDGYKSMRRYLADGTLDPSFSATFSAYPVKVMPSLAGKAFVLLNSFSYLENPRVVRLLSSGAIDPDFVAITAYSSDLARTAFCPLPDGGLLVIKEQGMGTTPNQSYLRFERYATDGSLAYAYNGIKDTFTIAGVMFDCLQATGLAGELSVDPTIFDYASGPLLPQWLDVRSDGQLSTYTQTSGYVGPVLRYLRTSLSSPSVPMAPVIGASDLATRVCNVGDFLMLNVWPLGGEPFAYQWMKDGQPIANRTTSPIPPNTMLLFRNDLQSPDAGNYSVVVSNAYGSATSASTAVKIKAPPVILTHPVGQLVNPGANTSLTVTVASATPLTYRWTKNPGDVVDTAGHIAGATTDTLTITNFQSADAGDYAVVVTNSDGTAFSRPATLSAQTPFGGYRAQYFNTTELADATISGPAADPDGDGLPNLLDYAAGQSPRSNDPTGLPVVGTDSGRLTLSYIRRSDAPDLTYTVQVSRDLIIWNSGADFTEQISVNPIDATRDLVTVRDLTSLSTVSRRFLRLMVSLPGNSSQIATPPVGAMNVALAKGTRLTGMPLLNAAVLRDGIASHTATTLTLAQVANAGARLAGSTSYFLEVTGGPASAYIGERFEVDLAATKTAANNTVVIVAASPRSTLATLPDGAALAGCQVAIRPHLTLGQLFGTKGKTLMSGATTVSGADQVQFLNAQTQSFEIYYLLRNGNGSIEQWTKVGGGSTNQDGTPIGSGTGMVVQRSAATPVTLTWLGEVRQNAFAQPLVAGNNLVSHPYPFNWSPSERALGSGNGFTGSTVSAAADQVQVYTGGGFQIYYLLRNPSGSVEQWTLVGGGGADYTRTLIGNGDGAVILRKVAADPLYFVPLPPYTHP